MDDASIRDFNGGIGCHVASALEQTLLLSKDMVELRGFRRSEVFLHTKRLLGIVCTYFSTVVFVCFFFFLFNTILIPFFFFFFKAVQSTFRLEEMTNSLSQQLDDERKTTIAAMQTLTIVENSNADLKKRLTAKEQARKSANVALKGAKRQAESQRKLANEANEQLAASKEQLVALKKQLDEAQRLRDQAEKARVQVKEDKAKAKKERNEAEQHGYDVGVAETKDALSAEVPAVCHAYCT